MELNTSDTQKVEQLEKEIKGWLKKAKISFNVAESLVLVSIFLTIILLASGVRELKYSVGAYIGFGVLYVMSPLYKMFYLGEFDEETSFPQKDSDKKVLYIICIVTACPLVRLILGSLFAGMLTCAYFTGWYWGLACIPNFCGYVFIISAYQIAKSKWKIQYADDIQAHTEYKEKKKQLAQKQAEAKQRENERNTVSNLLSKVGNKFFVKYYMQLRDWSEPDILDIIEEDYTEETKRQRIKQAKNIFKYGLNVLALKQISDENNVAVDTQTKEIAKSLLEKIRNKIYN